VPSVTDVDPLRCSKCKTFCNPFWKFIEQGRRVQCNICGELNSVDAKHYSKLNEDGYPENIADRVELMNGCYEINVGDDFANKTPGYPVYLFVVDVSYPSIQSGVAQSAFAAIHAAVKGNYLSGQSQSSFGIVCIDTKLHLLKFDRFRKKPQIVTMSGNFETCPVPPSQILVSAEDLQEETLDCIQHLHEGFAPKQDVRASIPVKSIVLLANM
jgi:protein transport protein SEC24